MVRVIGATCLMIVQLAGPLLCCCMTPRPAVSALHRSAAGPEVLPASDHSCCDHHTSKDDRQTPNAPQSPDRPGCPCKQDTAQTAGALATDSDSVKQVQLRQLPQDLAVAPSALPADVASSSVGICAAPRERQALPFLSADDILNVLHILRC